MKKHNILIFSIFVIAFALTGCGGRKQENFAYQLCWNDAGIDVELTYTYPVCDTITLFYGDPGLGGQHDLFSCVKKLNVEGATWLADSINSRIQLFDFKANPVKINYRVEQSLPDTGLNCPREVFRPNITADMLYSLGPHLFLLPEEERVQGESIPAQVTWNEAPDFPVFCLYNPGNGTEDFSGFVLDLWGSVLVGGWLLHVDTLEIAGVRNYVVTAPRTLAEYNIGQLKVFFKTFYAAAVDFWEDDPESPYSLMVYPFQKIPFEVSGLGLYGGFFARYSAQADTILTHNREQTFAHEIGHNWIGAGGDMQWWGEGFNDFHAIYLVTAAGMQTPQNFIDFLNDYLNSLYHSEIRNLPNEEIDQNFWNLGDYSWIPYWRGAVYALRIVGQIEQQTGTDHAFKDLMMALKPYRNTLTMERFLEVTGGFIDKEALKDDFTRYILEAETMDLKGDPLPSGCEARYKDDGTPYLVITDEIEFRKHFVL